jgi:YbbR domain-containing protein
MNKVFKFIKNFFKNNTGPKILAIAIAAILWIYVSSSQSTAGKFPGSINLRSTNTPPGLIAIYDQSMVDVEIIASPADWKKLSADSFSATVDLNGLSEGTYQLEISVTCSIPDVKITKISPAKTFVSLERIITKSASININSEGAPADGLAVGEVVLNPETVEVSGASSVINNLTEATATLALSGESNDFEKSLRVFAKDESGNEIKNLTFNPEHVNAQVDLIRASNSKTVGIKVMTTGTPKDGFYVSGVSVTPSTIDIAGSSAAISVVSTLETEKVDISGASSTIERSVALNLPNGVAISTGSGSRVRITISFTESEISKTIAVNIVAGNLDSGLRMTYSPTDIKAVLSGSTSAIAALGQSVDYKLDLSGKPAGQYTQALSTSNLVLPGGVTAISVVPSSVTITLENK